MAYVFLWKTPFLLALGLGSIIGGLFLGTIIPTTFTSLIPESVLNGLLVVISIFIGYVSVVVIFYLGKMDDYERDFLYDLRSVRLFQDELFRAVRQLYSWISTLEHRTQIEEAAKEDLRDRVEKMESDPLYTEKTRDDIINEIRDFRNMTIRWGVFSLLMCLFALSGIIVGLIALKSHALDLLMPLLSCTLVIMGVNFFMLIQFWHLGQHMMNTYRKLMVQSQDYIDSGLAKGLIEFNKKIRNENKEKD